MKNLPYLIETGYISDAPVEAADLDRRARVLNSQLPGALRAAALSSGVFPLWTPDETLPREEQLASLAAATGAALKVSLSGGFFNAAAGAAAIALPGSTALVFAQTSGVSAANPGGDVFVHLMLASADDPLSPGAVDGRIGSPPFLLVSDTESEEGGILLAAASNGALTDKRRFTVSPLLALELQKTNSRLDALGAPIEAGEGKPITAAQFLALQETVAFQGMQLAGLQAEVDALKSTQNDNFPTPLDQAFDEIAINRVGLAEVNAHAIERGQISVITVSAGHGQDDTPDYSPDTGAENELAFNAVDGTFGS
jgi:hypothetical protein